MRNIFFPVSASSPYFIMYFAFNDRYAAPSNFVSGYFSSLRSNAKDKVEDIKSMGIDLAAFRIDKFFNYGALCIMVIITILYACFW